MILVRLRDAKPRAWISDKESTCVKSHSAVIAYSAQNNISGVAQSAELYSVKGYCC